MKTVKFSQIKPGQTYEDIHGKWRCLSQANGRRGGISLCLEHKTTDAMVGRSASGIACNKNVRIEEDAQRGS
jgi:hypothetical protein